MRTGLWILLFLFWVPAQAGLLDKFGSAGGDEFLPVEQVLIPFPANFSSTGTAPAATTFTSIAST
ncbi:MAG: hypothetical protein VW274_01880 [Thalassolituus sp.]